MTRSPFGAKSLVDAGEELSPRMTGKWFHEVVMGHGYNFFTGVPDSTLRSIFTAFADNAHVQYHPAVREDNAVGLAVGAYLGGLQPLILMQNSGLGQCLTALTSLAILYEIPMMLVIGWRGADPTDAPEHILMGEITQTLLQSIGLPTWTPNPGDLHASIDSAVSHSKLFSCPVALLLREGVVQ